MSNTITEALPVDADVQLSSKIKHIIATLIGMEESEIVTSASFEDDLGVDSLDVTEIIAAVEKKFKITIPDEDAEKLTTVASLINYVKVKKYKK